MDPLFAYFFLILLINMMKKELEAGMDAHYTKKERKNKKQDKSTDPSLSPDFTFQNYWEIEK